jgi:hypothetical protein
LGANEAKAILIYFQKLLLLGGEVGKKKEFEGEFAMVIRGYSDNTHPRVTKRPHHYKKVAKQA